MGLAFPRQGLEAAGEVKVASAGSHGHDCQPEWPGKLAHDVVNGAIDVLGVVNGEGVLGLVIGSQGMASCRRGYRAWQRRGKLGPSPHGAAFAPGELT